MFGPLHLGGACGRRRQVFAGVWLVSSVSRKTENGNSAGARGGQRGWRSVVGDWFWALPVFRGAWQLDSLRSVHPAH